MAAQPEERAFPLDVIAVPNGWCIVVHLRNGREWRLMKPGWEEESHAPYVFTSQEEAWAFLKKLFQFCLMQRHIQYTETDKITNCEHCGRIFRARFFQVCPQCMQENEFMLQQIWQGFYYLVGSEEAALEKMSLLLKIPLEQCMQIPLAFNTMVKKNLSWHLDWEKQQKALQAQAELPKPVSHMHHRRRD